MDPTGVLRGIDVSHHQEDIDVGRLPVDFVIARTAQAAGGKYGTTIDRAYIKHKANAGRVGKLFSSYLYLGNAISAAANAALHASIEPDRRVPVMVDWEDGSGDGAFLRAVVAELGKLGYRVWGTYAPRWYWQRMGEPSLAGLPPLVSSRYPDRVPGDFDAQYRKIPTNFWDGYGGNTVTVVQISANGRLQPYPGTDLDLNAFRGTRDQLAALLGGNTPAPRKNTEDHIVKLEAKLDTAGQPVKAHAEIPVCGGKALRLAVSYGNSVQIHGVTGVYDTPSAKGGRTVPVAAGFKLDADRPGPINTLPQDGLSHVVVEYTSAVDFTGWVA